METLVSTRDAYVALFKVLPLGEQQAIYEMIRELLEDIEDGLLIEERKDDPKEDYMVFRQRLIKEGKINVPNSH